jgi:DNA-binding NtrC family response regulator
MQGRRNDANPSIIRPDQGRPDNVITHHDTSSELTPDKPRPPYVLIVEDDRALGELLFEVFRGAGNRCFVIRSKRSAEQFLRQVRPDLVVVDYQLIGGVGLEAAQIASAKNVPVIMTSGHRNIFERVKGAGYFCLRKPFTPSEVLSLASVALGTDLSLPGHPPIQLH